MSEGEWGPLIRHDGAAPMAPTPCRLHVYFEDTSGLMPQPDGKLHPDWPGFYWRWKAVRTGWFKTERKRVCDNPDYAPIIAYRVWKPGGLVVLERLLEDLPRETEGVG